MASTLYEAAGLILDESSRELLAGKVPITKKEVLPAGVSEKTLQDKEDLNVNTSGALGAAVKGVVTVSDAAGSVVSGALSLTDALEKAWQWIYENWKLSLIAVAALFWLFMGRR